MRGAGIGIGGGWARFRIDGVCRNQQAEPRPSTQGGTLRFGISRSMFIMGPQRDRQRTRGAWKGCSSHRINEEAPPTWAGFSI